MPFYEYCCESCGHELEELQKINDPDLKDCPACNKPELRKLVSAAAFKLTGTGWYETDFKDNKKDSKSKEDGSSSESNSSNSGNNDATAKKDGSDSSKTAKKETKKTKKDSQSTKTKKDSK